MNLKEYVEKQNQSNYFSGLLERYNLATELICTFNDMYSEKNGKVKMAVPFFSPESIDIKEVESEDPALFHRYQVLFPEVGEFDSNEPYSNYLYGDNRAFFVKTLLGKTHESSNSEVANIYKAKDGYAVSTLSRILFYIYFGYHPFCGRLYYAQANMNDFEIREFFKDKHNFIFCLEKSNPNRFINGYQSFAWLLWESISDEQRSFWNEVLAGEIDSYSIFYDKWKKAYSNFICSLTHTPCGVKLPTIVYSEEYALVTSDTKIANKTIRCRECNNGMTARCESCKVNVNNRNATFFTMAVNVVNTRATGDETVDVSQEVVLYGGKGLSKKDLGISDETALVFDAVLSKKANLIGLKYLLDTPIKATCGSVVRFYEKDGTIALLPGTNIYVVPNECRIVVPGEPLESTAPISPNIQIAEPKSNKEQGTSDNVSKDSSTEKKPEMISENPPEKEAVAVSVTEANPIEQDDEKLVFLENGDVCDVVSPDPVERTGYKLYKVRSRNQQKTYVLKLFDTPEDEKKGEIQKRIIDNLRSVLSKKLSLPLTLIYPKAIFDSTKGFCKDKLGYICNEWPDNVVPSELVINESGKVDFESKEISMLLDLCGALKILHDKGLFYKSIRAKNVLYNTDEGRGYLIDNDFVSSESFKGMRIRFEYDAPEVIAGNNEPDSLTDSYAFAVIAFMTLYKKHPYGNSLWKERPKSSYDDRKSIYFSNPHYCFANHLTNETAVNSDASVASDGISKDRWDATPDYMRVLFDRTFDVLPSHAADGFVKTRSLRPTIQDWKDALNNWYHALVSKKR